jgi:hypothetical protein
MTETPQETRTTDLANGRRWALRAAVVAMALTFIPYLFGWSLIGADSSRGWFSWLGYNLDDSCVYLSWMRQAADGHFFQRNLFTTEQQVGHQFSVFFLLLGNIARFLHLPLLFVYHASRLVLGVAFLRAVWSLLELLIVKPGARKVSFLLVCFSAGLGWLPGLWSQTGIQSPVDVWQPEAITYLCLYLSPLFLVSLLLMVGVMGNLIVAERTGKMRPAVYAGICGLLLGNIHTYDVITLIAVWGGYRIVRATTERKFDARAWLQAVVAGALTGISTAYMVYLVRTEEVFAKRVAVQTLSPEFVLYLKAYGPLIILALAALFALRRSKTGEEELIQGSSSLQLLVTWAVLNMAVAYLPVDFNRKMLMGEHFPLAILAGVGLYALTERIAARQFVIAAAVVLLALTNVRFSMRDMNNFILNRGQSLIQRPYLMAGEVASLNWIRENAPVGAAIQPLPWVQRTPEGKIAFVDTTVACLAPGLTGHPVHAGHWGETPEFGKTMLQWVRFLNPNIPESDRLALLRQTGVRYLVFSQKSEEGLANPNDPRLLSFIKGAPPTYLRLIPEASNEQADVYEVTP